MDALNRTSRWTRGTTKKVRLVPRDFDIFHILHRYRYLPTEYLHAFAGGKNYKRFQNRLTSLWWLPNCYIERSDQQIEFFNANYRQLIYELDQNGEKALRDNGLWDDDAPVAWLSRGRHNRTMFPHSVMICEALANIELAIKGTELRFIPWSEIKANMPEPVRNSKDVHCLPVNISHKINDDLHHSDKALMPDAVFGIEFPDGKARFFALECDRDHEPLERTNLNQTSILRKLLQYKAVFKARTYATHWGLPNLFMLMLTTPDRHGSDGHMHKMIAQAVELFGSNDFMLFKTMPAFGGFLKPEPPTGRLLTEPWLRPGREALRIDRPTERR